MDRNFPQTSAVKLLSFFNFYITKMN